MRPSRGYISLGMRDVRASPPPVPKDAERRAENRAHAEAYKERKDAEEARRKRKSLERDELEKRRRQQRHDGLLVEPSPSSSSMNFSCDDDESEVGRGPLDDLPDVRETAPGASPGGGGEDALRLAIARPGAEADTPEIWASGKRAVSPMGSTAEVEQATARATQPPPQRVKGASESDEGRPVPADTGAVLLPPPPPLLRTRDAVWKLFRKRQAETPAPAPRKALKVSTSSTARWVVDAQAALRRGAASARADPKEPVAQGEATEAAMKQAGEEAPTPREVRAVESGEAEAPSIAEATEGEVEAPRTSEAEVAEAGASRASEAEVADAGAPRTTEAEVAEAGLGAAEPAAQDAETEAGQASVPPPSQESAREVEVHSISSDDTSRGKDLLGRVDQRKANRVFFSFGSFVLKPLKIEDVSKEVADAEAASTAEQPALTSGEGSSTLVRVQPEPRGWDSPHVLWRSRDDPEGEPLFALEDADEGGGHWGSFEQFRRLAERSLRTALSVVADNLPGVAQELEARSLEKSMFLRRERNVWDQLRQQKDLLATANELLSARSAEELEEELTRVAGERDTFMSQAEQEAASAKAVDKQLEAEQGAAPADERVEEGGLLSS
ncbi:uncharacterized protein [Miscanthus floridulus]|uniref:uncharacterized protein n=1 Tax=Miscanthus floridulus TaxID=154761 RepID=UPI00345A98D7